MKILVTVVIALLAALILGAVVIHGGGLTNFAGDEPHPAWVNGAIELARERFIAARSATIEVPDLADPKRIADGAAHYAAMCAGCHLGPGTQDTEIRRGLYPQPPNLAQPASHSGGHDHSDAQTAAKRQFWIIKHGIKMTGMPAWGATHDDDAIWALVAFLQKLPDLSPEEYRAMTAMEAAHPPGSGQADSPDAPARDHGPQSAQPAEPTSGQHTHGH